jgi:Ca-activated chloride channel homolog
VKFAESLWLLGTLLALVVAGLLVLGAFAGVRALRRFGEEGPVDALLTAKVGSRRALKGTLSVLGLAACFVALAQPQYGWGTRRIPATNLDVVVVLDYSKSMFARDVAPNRIERAKSEVARLITQLAGARFGAVAFAGEPLSFPLTSDGGAIAQFFRQLSPHDMPVGGTAIARALEAGRSLLERDPQSSKHKRVMLLVTDGEDLEGDPVQAARLAKDSRIAIYVVQIGGRTPEPIPDVDEQGVDRGLRRNERGEVMTTSLSAEGEQQLAQIAEITGASVVQSGNGATGIEEVARLLRAMMTEELSERVETVYADVYAYPLAVALLLLCLEAFVPEVRPRRRRRAAEKSKAASLQAALDASAEHAGAGEPRTRRRELARSGASALLPLCVFGLWSGASGCDSAAVDKLFTRHAPQVDDAISALEAQDAGAAERHLTSYLGLAACRDGSINASAALAERAQASFDLGLALFRIGERFGGRFGEDPGQAEDDPRLLAKRSAEVACAQSVVQQLVARPNLPVELRAQAYYLLGNLEFLRREYDAAISSYDRSLGLVPGDDAATALPVGRDAAHNRALALRRREENKPPPENPDAAPPEPGDGGPPPDEPPPGDGGSQQNQDQDDSEKKDPDKPSDQKQPKPDPKSPEDDPQAKQDSPEPSPQEQDSKGQEPPAPKEQKGAPPPQNLSLSQDDKMLDQLERAPTVQQEAARAQRGRVRRVGEDK